MYKSTGIESCLLNFPDVVDIIIFPCHILMIFDFIIYIGNFADVPFIIFISKVWPWRHLTKGHRASHNVLRRTQIPGPPCSKLRWLKTHTHCMKITIRSYQIISDHICHICHIKSMEKNGSFKCQKPPISSDILQVFFWEFCRATDVSRAWGAELPNCSLPSCPDPVSVPRRVNSIVDVICRFLKNCRLSSVGLLRTS